MKNAISFTHHLQKPEYQWELSVEDQPVVLLRAEGLERALEMLGISPQGPEAEQIRQLGNGEVRAVEVDLPAERLAELHALSIK